MPDSNLLPGEPATVLTAPRNALVIFNPTAGGRRRARLDRVLAHMRALGGGWSEDSARSPQNRVPKFVAPNSCSDRRFRSRTFPGFRPIYPRGSVANCTKLHQLGRSTRPGTLFREGSYRCISGAKIQGVVIGFLHSFARAHLSANFQQG